MAVIQIRGVSDIVHARLKSRAASEGQSLSEYLRIELEHLANLTSLDEALMRVGSRKPVGGMAATQAIDAERRLRR